MNKVIDVIHQRRSVRSYKKESVDRELIETVIEAGNMAPNGSSQSWRFVAVTEKDTLNKLKELSLPYYKGFMEHMPDSFKEVRAQIDSVVDDPVFYSAPVVLYIVGSGMTKELDCSMVCQNIMIAAESLGLNSCYVYFGQLVLDHPEIKELISIGENEQVFGPVLLGYGTETQPYSADKKKSSIDWV